MSMTQSVVYRKLDTNRVGRPHSCDPVGIVQMLADGRSIRSVAEVYGVHSSTVRVAITRLRDLYKIKTTSQLVAHFLRNGWVD